MHLRELGETGILVSEIGLGAWQLGNEDWGGPGEDEALEVVHAAFDLGCNFFDTAPIYAGGRSEAILGQALRGRRDQAVICTKFGKTPQGETAFETNRLRPLLEGSLRRLQTDYVDVLLVHSPPEELLDGTQTDLYDQLEILKQAGKLRAYGASVDYARDMDTVLTTTQSQAIEILFNAFHQEPLTAFPRARQKGAGLIVKVPLDSGWLTGKYNAQSDFQDVRERWSRQVIERRARLVESFQQLLPQGTPVIHGALQFILSQEEVSTVIPGAKSVQQVEHNLSAAESRLPDEVVRQIHELWENEIQDHPLPW